MILPAVRPPLVLVAVPMTLELRAMERVLAAQPETITLAAVGEIDIYRRVTAAGTVYDLAVVLSGQGNVTTADVLATVLAALRPRLVTMSGIAAALKDVGVGDVVLATEVAYAEPGRAEAELKPRYRRRELRNEPRNLVQRFDGLDELRVVAGVIVSQEMVLASFDSPDYQRIRAYASDAIAVDTESWGLASSAANRELDWFIARGISDDIVTKGDADPQDEVAHSAARVLVAITERWLDRLAARQLSELARPVRPADALELPEGWQPTEDVEQIQAWLGREPALWVVGPGGAGKTTLARALRLGRQEVVPGGVIGFVEFTAVTDAELAAQTLSNDLASQLPTFAYARQTYELSQSFDALRDVSAFERFVAGPMRNLHGPAAEIVLVLDGVERLPPGGRNVVEGWIEAMGVRRAGAHARLLVFGRQPPQRSEVHTLELEAPSTEAMTAYAAAQGLPLGQRGDLVALVPRTWLEVEQATTALARGERPSPAAADGSSRARCWYTDRIRAVAGAPPSAGLLALLAPVPRVVRLPLAFVGQALRALMGPEADAVVLAESLGDLIVFEEHEGVPTVQLAHDLIGEAVVASALVPLNEARNALVAAFEATPRSAGDVTRQFVAEIDAERLLSAAQPVEAADRVRRSMFSSLRENAARLEWWSRRIAAIGGPAAEHAVAHLEIATALTRSELQPPSAARKVARGIVDEYGSSDDPQTALLARLAEATIIGHVEDNALAADRLQRLIPDMRRALGPNSWDLLSAEMELAYTEAMTGQTPEEIKWRAGRARERFSELGQRATALFGPGDEHSLNGRHNEAFFTGRSGDPHQAVRLYRELLPNSRDFRGERYAETLTIRHEIAFWAGEGGDVAGALEAFEALLPARIEVMGPNHPRTLRNRLHIARLARELGRSDAQQLAAELVRDAVLALGADDEVSRAALGLLTGPPQT